MENLKYGITLMNLNFYDENNCACEVFSGQLFQENEFGLFRFYSVKQKLLIYTPNLFKATNNDDEGTEEAGACASISTNSENLRYTTEKIWLILLAIQENAVREKIIQMPKFIEFLMKIQKGSRVSVAGSVFDLNHDIICLVGYVGNVPEIGPGTFYGFIVESIPGIPARNNLPWKYMNCANSRGFFRAADCLMNTRPLRDRSLLPLRSLSLQSYQGRYCGPMSMPNLKFAPAVKATNNRSLVQPKPQNKNYPPSKELKKLRDEIHDLKEVIRGIAKKSVTKDMAPAADDEGLKETRQTSGEKKPQTLKEQPQAISTGDQTTVSDDELSKDFSNLLSFLD